MKKHEMKTGYLICSTLDLLFQLRACTSIYKMYVCILIYLHMNVKIVCWEFKWLRYTFIWVNCLLLCQSFFKREIRSFAWRRTSQYIVVPHVCYISYRHFIIAPKKLKLDFNICTIKWIFWLKTVPGKTTSNYCIDD